MRDDNMEPRDNQQIADDNQQSGVAGTRDVDEQVTNAADDEDMDEDDDEDDELSDDEEEDAAESQGRRRDEHAGQTAGCSRHAAADGTGQGRRHAEPGLEQGAG